MACIWSLVSYWLWYYDIMNSVLCYIALVVTLWHHALFWSRDLTAPCSQQLYEKNRICPCRPVAPFTAWTCRPERATRASNISYITFYVIGLPIKRKTSLRNFKKKINKRTWYGNNVQLNSEFKRCLFFLWELIQSSSLRKSGKNNRCELIWARLVVLWGLLDNIHVVHVAPSLLSSVRIIEEK